MVQYIANARNSAIEIIMLNLSSNYDRVLMKPILMFHYIATTHQRLNYAFTRKCEMKFSHLISGAHNKCQVYSQATISTCDRHVDIFHPFLKIEYGPFITTADNV